MSSTRPTKRRYRHRIGAAAVATIGSLLVVPPANAAEPVRVFASPDGAGTACSDAMPCTLPTAVAQAHGNSVSDVVVYLKGGRYEITNAVQIGAAQSGLNGRRVIVRNYPAESPVLSGGRPITGWELSDSSKNIWAAEAPDFPFFQLYGDGTMFTRARTPAAIGTRWTTAGAQELRVRAPASIFPAGFPETEVGGLAGVQVRFMHTWRELRYPVTKIGKVIHPSGKPDMRFLYLKTPTAKWRDDGTQGFRTAASASGRVAVETPNGPRPEPGGETFLEGMHEFIDQDGEWHLDRGNSTVYLKSSVDPDLLNVIAPKVGTLMKIAGASHVTIYGLQFAHSGWTEPLEHGNFQRQGGANMRGVKNGVTSQGLGKFWTSPAAVEIGDAVDTRLQRNGFRDTGANAVNLDKGTIDIRFIGNIFQRLSDSGLFVGTDQEPFPGAGDGNVNTIVRNNLFDGMGRTYATDSAITMTYPHGATIAHNLIRNVNNIGINIGWFNTSGSGTQETVLQDVQVTANRIENVCITARDCGGLHTLRLYPYGNVDGGVVPRSTVIRNEITGVHENPLSTATASHVHALYLDATTSGLDVRGNQWSDVDDGLYENVKGGALNNCTVPNNGESGSAQDDDCIATAPPPSATAGLEDWYRLLLDIDLDTDSVGGSYGPYPSVQ